MVLREAAPSQRLADTGDEPMNIYRLDPIEPGHPNWRFSH